MDKLMDNPWFLKGVALVLAFLLFSSVPDGGGNKSTDENVPASQKVETIEDVPVKSYFDTENFVVSGVPNTVKLTIQGPKSIVQTAKSIKDFEVYVDLTDAKIGKQKVKIKVKNISDKLKVTVNPATANVSVQEKVTKEFKVEAEYNRNLLDEGYIADPPVVQPNKVKITGAKGDIEKINYVKATVDVKGPIQETIVKQAQVLVLDQQLNKLNVTIEPATVKVTIPVKNSNKSVPIHVIQTGTAQNGISIDDITLDIKEAKITGKDDVVKATESVRVEVDISKITEDTVVTVPVIVPDGVTKVTPEVVKATIKVKKEEQKTISNVSIKPEGLGALYDLIFKNPSSGKIYLSVSGPSEVVEPLTASDFEVSVNITNLTEGDHEVPISTNGPNNVTVKLERETATVSIVKKEV
jgi:YbbR domain-containing protein